MQSGDTYHRMDSVGMAVCRVAVISSNHAADYYEKLIWTDRIGFVTPDRLPLSDN